MFTDPQTITINSIAKTLARVMQNGTSAVYKTADGNFTFTISHQTSGKSGNSRIRTMVRLDQRAVVADPLTAENDYQVLSQYYVIDRPEVGFTDTQVDQHRAGLTAWLTTANVGKLFGQES